MLRLSANLSMLFQHLPFLDRFDAAADAGFKAVEFLFPYSEAPEVVADRLRTRGLTCALFNFPAGDWAGGERGIASHPDRIVECHQNVDTALAYARALDCPRLHLMPGKIPAGADPRFYKDTFLENLAHAADRAAGEGITILLEPINSKIDMPGYFYSTTDAACAMIDQCGRPNVKLQYDIYHMQIMEGDLARTIERLMPRIGHMQLADNPGRGEPGTGEINFPWLLQRIDRLGYDGWIGCEYIPVADTVAGLDWAVPYL
jgi:hydroxypyruvate isomerase